MCIWRQIFIVHLLTTSDKSQGCEIYYFKFQDGLLLANNFFALLHISDCINYISALCSVIIWWVSQSIPHSKICGTFLAATSLKAKIKFPNWDPPHNYWLQHIYHCRSFWRHVLLPSWHKPIGNGMEWLDIKEHCYTVSDTV